MPPRKKECELGSKCPYQDQHQHLQEFSHTQQAQTTAFKGRGQKLGGGAGVGRRLGGEVC